MQRQNHFPQKRIADAILFLFFRWRQKPDLLMSTGFVNGQNAFTLSRLRART